MSLVRLIFHDKFCYIKFNVITLSPTSQICHQQYNYPTVFTDSQIDILYLLTKRNQWMKRIVIKSSRNELFRHNLVCSQLFVIWTVVATALVIKASVSVRKVGPGSDVINSRVMPDARAMVNARTEHVCALRDGMGDIAPYVSTEYFVSFILRRFQNNIQSDRDQSEITMHSSQYVAWSDMEVRKDFEN